MNKNPLRDRRDLLEMERKNREEYEHLLHVEAALQAMNSERAAMATRRVKREEKEVKKEVKALEQQALAFR
jgi:hypothetical protein